MKYETPDYQNCCVNIIASIGKYFGVNTGHKSLPCIDRELKKGYKNVVFLLLDGMGQFLINRKLPAESFLRKHFAQELSAVFPSSTTPATVSIKSGLTPLEHGWWSHFLYFKEAGAVVNLYLNTDNFTRKQLPLEHIAHQIMPYDTILDRIYQNTDVNTHCYALCSDIERDKAGITQITYQSFDEMSDYIHTLTQNEGKNYIYAYHNLPDDLMHKTGPYSSDVENLLNDLDAQVEYLCNRCPDTLFLISADHGQTEIHEVRDVADYPDFTDCLVIPPHGLTRCSNLFVKQNRNKELERLFKKYFADKFLLIAKKDVLENQLLGDGTPHYKIDDTLGDYIMVAISDCNLTYTTIYENSIIQPLGHHGGLTTEEMRVPLIMFGDKMIKK